MSLEGFANNRDVRVELILRQCCYDARARSHPRKRQLSCHHALPTRLLLRSGQTAIISCCQAVLCRCPLARDVSRLYQLDLRKSPNQASLKFKFIVGGVKPWVAVNQVIRRVTVNTPTARIHLLVCVHL